MTKGVLPMQHKRVFNFVGLFLAAAMLAAACNTPVSRQARSADPSEKDTGASSGGENADDGQSQDQSGSGDQEEREYPPNYGNRRVEYNHKSVFNAMIGGQGLQMEFNIKGDVPLQETAIGYGPLICNGQTIDWPYEKLHGSSTVTIEGSGTFSAGDENCACTFTDTIDANINGITFSKFFHEGDACQTQFVALQFNDKWYTNPDWSCSCSEPEKNPIAERNMNQIPAFQPPGLAEKTLIFNMDCPGTFRQDQLIDPTGTGNGYYEWTWRPGNDEVKGPDAVVTQTYDEVDNDEFPMGPPSCVWVAEPEWGPPLSSIDPGVTTWE